MKLHFRIFENMLYDGGEKTLPVYDVTAEPLSLSLSLSLTHTHTHTHKHTGLPKALFHLKQFTTVLNNFKFA
jgi:hypothetical protein